MILELNTLPDLWQMLCLSIALILNPLKGLESTHFRVSSNSSEEYVSKASL